MIVLAIIALVLYLITDSSVPWYVLLALFGIRFLYILYMNHLIGKDINAYERDVKKFLDEIESFEKSMGMLSEGSRNMLVHVMATGCLRFYNVMDQTGCSHRDIVMAVIAFMGPLLNDPVASMKATMLVENQSCLQQIPVIVLNKDFLTEVELNAKMSS